jgi:hypothetical protein
MTQKHQCDYVSDKGQRCLNTARRDSMYCRRHELDLQKKHQLLGFPKDDFYDTHETPLSIKILVVGSVLMVASLIPSMLAYSWTEIQRLSLQPITFLSLFQIVSNAAWGLLIIAISAAGFYSAFAETTSVKELKRSRRTQMWKITGLFVFPLSVVVVVTSLLINSLIGWDHALPKDWFTVIGGLFLILYGWTIYRIMREPRLYFNRRLSMALDVSMIALGLLIAFQPMVTGASKDVNFVGLFMVSMAIGWFIRTLTGKESIAQQIIASIYRLPDMLKSLVSEDDRHIALAIALGHFQNMTSVQREELSKYLALQQKPTRQQKIANYAKATVVTFVVVLLVESPAQYLFNKIVELFASNK